MATEDPSRLDRLVRSLKSLANELVRSGHRDADAPDIAQEALIKTWQRLDSIEPGSETAYLRQTARHIGRNDIRDAKAKKRGAGLVSAFEEDTDAVDETLSAEGTLIRQQELTNFRALFNAEFGTLPELTRQSVILRKRGWSYEDIARALGCTPQSIRTRVSRAARQLRESLGQPPDGISWADVLEGEDE